MDAELPAARSDVWSGVAVGTYQARSSQWRQRMGHGPIQLEADCIRWLGSQWRWQRWFHPLVTWAPAEVVIPLELIENARSSGRWYAPMLRLEVEDARFQLRIGRGYFTLGAGAICRDWAGEILRRRDRLRGNRDV